MRQHGQLQYFEGILLSFFDNPLQCQYDCRMLSVASTRLLSSFLLEPICGSWGELRQAKCIPPMPSITATALASQSNSGKSTRIAIANKWVSSCAFLDKFCFDFWVVQRPWWQKYAFFIKLGIYSRQRLSNGSPRNGCFTHYLGPAGQCSTKPNSISWGCWLKYRAIAFHPEIQSPTRTTSPRLSHKLIQWSSANSALSSPSPPW